MTMPNLKLARRAAYSLALIGAFVTAGCEGSNDPDAAVGNYVATSFVTTENGQSFNHISNGSEITLSLASGGTTTGILHIEAAGGDPDFNANLSGTWTRDGSTVDLDHSADTFIRDMPLTLNGDTLTGDETFSGVRIQLTLTRVGDID